MDRLGSKQPYEEYHVAFNFANVIGSATIATANVVVKDATNATCTAALTTIANQTLATNIVYIWIKGGVSDIEYQITCQIETNSTPAEKYELDAILPVAEL